MGTRARIVIYAPDQETARQAATAAFERIEQLEQIMSDYRPDSELMRACTHAGEPHPIPISRDLAAVLGRSLEISSATAGAFDVTIGPVVRLWRQARKAGVLPTLPQLAEAVEQVGSRYMHVDEQNRTLVLDRHGMQLDLGGIGKGFAAEEAYRVLNVDHGLPSALVDLGGDLRVGAAPPDRPEGWSIAIQTHDPKRTDRTVHLTDCAIATSGDLDQFVEIDGVRYSHIVNPHTGLGLTNRVAVTVIGPDAATADALASAISVLGAEKGMAVLQERFAGYVVSVAAIVDPAGNVAHMSSDGFPAD